MLNKQNYYRKYSFIYGYQIKKFLSDRIIHPTSIDFYEKGNKLRHYFYVLDLKGHLHLESNHLRNITTSIKDIKVLNFICKNIQFNTSLLYPEIPYLSLCGKEYNFISTIDPYCVFVFKDLIPIMPSEINDNKNDHRKQDLSYNNILLTNEWHLIYGGDLVQKFDPSLLAYSISNGRIYHRITSSKINNKLLYIKKEEQDKEYYGLLASHIISRYLLDNIVRNDFMDDTISNDKGSNSSINTSIQQKEVVLNWNPMMNDSNTESFMYKMKIIK